MSYWKNRYEYCQLLNDFINSDIDGLRFESEFYKMMRTDRDRHRASKLGDVLSRIFTACDVFDPDPETRTEYEYGETELRNFVRDIFAENRNLFE